MQWFASWRERGRNAVRRVRFGNEIRADVYEMLAILLESGEQVVGALRIIRDAYNEESTSPLQRRLDDVNTRVRTWLRLPARAGSTASDKDAVRATSYKAHVMAQWIAQLKAGDGRGYPFSRAVREWVPRQEAALIHAGESTGDLSRALRDCIEDIQSTGAIGKTVAILGAYPLLLLAGGYNTMSTYANKVLPPFLERSDPETWEGSARLLYLQSMAFTHYGPALAVGFVALLVLSLLALPVYRGPGRMFLDAHVPPFTIYRAIHGGTFLKNVAVQIRAGIILNDGVAQMLPYASPWLKQRLEAILVGLAQGSDLGVSLRNAGYGFPDKRAIAMLVAMAARDGFDASIYEFAKKWQARTFLRVKVSMAGILVATMLLVTGVTAVAIVGMQGISKMLQSETDSYIESR